jgi:LysM repeat protein
MDTISHERNRSHLVLAAILAGVLVGVVVLLLWSVTLLKINTLGKRVDNMSDRLARVPDNLPDQLATIESKADGAVAASDKANANIAKLQTSVQSAFDSIGPEIGNIKASIQRLQYDAISRVAAPKVAKAEPAVAGPGEYIVKPGDTGMKIANATGLSLSELEAINPGIDWKRLRVGQKIKSGPAPSATEYLDRELGSSPKR